MDGWVGGWFGGFGWSLGGWVSGWRDDWVGGWILLQSHSVQALNMHDSVYRVTLCFIINCKPWSHRCELYSRVGNVMENALV